MVTGNVFLDLLQDGTRSQVLDRCERGSLPNQRCLYRSGAHAAHLYFLTAGFASCLVSDQRGAVAEVGSVGTDGVVGSLSLLGSSRMQSDCVMQTEGSCLRIPMPTARNLFQSNGELMARILQTVQDDALMSCRRIFCNAHHQLEQRLACWLLTYHARTNTSMVNITQERIAAFLSVRRTTVSTVCSLMEAAGLIRQQRGTMVLMDMAGLQQKACSCFSARMAGPAMDRQSAAAPAPYSVCLSA